MTGVEPPFGCTCPVNGWWGTVPPPPCPVHSQQFYTAPVVTLTGWICPRCHVVHAPHVDRCECAVATETGTATSIKWHGQRETVKP